MTRALQRATLTLSDPDEVTLEIPAEYDQALQAAVGQMMTEGVTIEIFGRAAAVAWGKSSASMRKN